MIETRLRVLSWIPEEAEEAPPRALERPRRPVSGRWFGAALAAQLLLLAFLPAGKYMAAASPTVVYLRTAPVDPVDFLRGRYVALRYAVEDGGAMAAVPGWKDLPPGSDHTVWLVLAPEAGPTLAGKPRPWAPVAVAGTLPEQLPAGRVALRATTTSNGVDLGLDRHHVPYADGRKLEADFGREGTEALVALRVDGTGRAMVNALHP